MHRSVPLVVALALVLTLESAPARAGTQLLIPPVEGAVARSFEDPRVEWGPGHRGVDYVVLSGTAVRAAGAGVVTFAGPVGTVWAVTIDHGEGLQTTYSDLQVTYVTEGRSVGQGTWIGLSDVAHEPSTGGLHFAVKLHGRYVDPELHLGPIDAGRAIHLVPTANPLPDYAGEAFLTAFDHHPPRRQRCVDDETTLPSSPPAPNDNVAVALAGLGSRTAGELSAAIYEDGPEALGYEDVYRFSYGGVRGPGFHEPYVREDTYVDISRSARRLGRLLRKIQRAHPDRSIDLIAHSQGGIVARTYLATVADAYEARRPRVEHLVTFASPHTGAPLAGAAVDLERTYTGGWVNDRLSEWASDGGPVPDPHAEAVRQLAPGSELMGLLAREDVAFGTRVLSLGTFNDGIVPADRALMPGEVGRVVGPAGVNAHDGILTSPAAAALAHAWLRDADPRCAGAWDAAGVAYGRYVSYVESRVPWLYGQIEEKVAGKLLKAGAKAWKALRG